MLIPVPLLNTDQIMLMAERRLLTLLTSNVVQVIDAEAKADFRFAGAGLVKTDRTLAGKAAVG